MEKRVSAGILYAVVKDPQRLLADGGIISSGNKSQDKSADDYDTGGIASENNCLSELVYRSDETTDRFYIFSHEFCFRRTITLNYSTD